MKKNIIFILYPKRIPLHQTLITSLSEKYNLHIIHIGKISQKQNNIYYYQLLDNKFLRKIHKTISSFKKFENYSIIQYILEKLYILLYKSAYLIIKKYIIINNISLIYTYNDRYTSCEIMILKAAYDYNIPVIIPLEIIIETDISIFNTKSILNTYNHQDASLYQKFIFNKFSKQKHMLYKGFFWYKPYVIEALSKCGILPKNPWIVGSSKATSKVGITSKVNLNILLQSGLEKEKAFLVGACSNDLLFYNKMNYTNLNKKIIIIALPQLYEHKYMSKKQAKYIHRSILNIVTSFSQYKTIISLHPTMDKINYLYLEKEFNCKITALNLNDILHTATLFIAIPSATIQWSILLEIKTIVIDLWNLNYTFLNIFNSFTYTQDLKTLHNDIIKILKSNISFEEDNYELGKSKIFTGDVINTYLETTKQLTKNIPKKRKTNSIFHSLYDNYLLSLNISIIKKCTSITQNFNSYFLAPYSPMTLKIKKTMEISNPNLIFLGFIDSKYKGKNIVNYEEFPYISKKTIIIIKSPNHQDKILEQLLQHVSEKNIKISNL